jgi:hypothetical protein
MESLKNPAKSMLTDLCASKLRLQTQKTVNTERKLAIEVLFLQEMISVLKMALLRGYDGMERFKLPLSMLSHLMTIAFHNLSETTEEDTLRPVSDIMHDLSTSAGQLSLLDPVSQTTAMFIIRAFDLGIGKFLIR